MVKRIEYIGKIASQEFVDEVSFWFRVSFIETVEL